MDRSEMEDKLVADFKSSVEKFLDPSNKMSFVEASLRVEEMMLEHMAKLEAACAALAGEEDQSEVSGTRHVEPEDEEGGSSSRDR